MTLNEIKIKNKLYSLERKIKCLSCNAEEVSFHDDFNQFPTIGKINIIYVDKTNNEQYIWNGISYDIVSGGGVIASNLGYTASPTNGIITNTSGTNATIPLADNTNAGLFTASEKTKLAGIESGAEVNNISDVNATDLTDGGETNLHIHDDRYYTETEVNNLLSLRDYTATTGTVISFDRPHIYNTPTSAGTGNITDNLTGAKIGVVQKIYHNSGSAPTFPAGWIRWGSGDYVTSVLNEIFCEWVSGTRVHYWIRQEA